MTRVTGTLHITLCSVVIISRSALLRMKNVSDKIIEKIKTHTLCLMIFFESRAFYEVMGKNIVELDRQ